MDPYQRVLAEPGSTAARRALAADWRAKGDPRGQLIEDTFALRDAEREGRVAPAERLRDKIDQAIRRHGKEWAGELAEFVDDHSYHRGLVAQLKIPGERFPVVASKIFTLAPIQHVNIIAPLGSLDAVLARPELRRLTSLSISNHGAAFGDRGALAVAQSAHLAGLKWLALWHDEIGSAGVEALAASPFLAKLAYLGLDGNPADPTPTVSDYDGQYTASRPALAETLEKQFGRRPWLAEPSEPEKWPPFRDDLAIT